MFHRFSPFVSIFLTAASMMLKLYLCPKYQPFRYFRSRSFFLSFFGLEMSLYITTAVIENVLLVITTAVTYLYHDLS
jgi:hypothetical protein